MKPERFLFNWNFIWTKSVYLGLIRPQSTCLQQTVCGLSCASSLEEASFWDDSNADQFDWCSVRRMVWALTGWPPTLSTTAAMLAELIRLFPKHNLWIRCWARALNFFGRPWRGLFWVEPVLLNRCMVLATVLHRSFRILAIILKFTPSLCRATNPPPFQPLQHSYVYFPNTTSGYDAEHVHSTSLVDHGEACSEWNLSC